jgi:site-specific DNA recombinase
VDGIRRSGSKPVITRFPAQVLEQFVKSQIHRLLQEPDKFIAGMEDNPSKGAAAERAKDLAGKWPKLEISKQHEFVRNILRRVTVGQTTVWIEIVKSKLLATLLGKKSETLPPSRAAKPDVLKLTGEFQVLRRGSELRLVTRERSCSEGTPVPSLVKAVARARDWYERIISGEVNTIDQLAQKSGLTRRYIRRILPFANLSPQITEIILTGKHRADLTLKELLEDIPSDWREQQNKILRPHHSRRVHPHILLHRRGKRSGLLGVNARKEKELKCIQDQGAA